MAKSPVVKVQTFVKGKGYVELFKITAKPSDTAGFITSKIHEMLGNTDRDVTIKAGRERWTKRLQPGAILGKLSFHHRPIVADVEAEAAYLERKKLKLEKEQCCEKLDALLTGWIPSHPNPSPNNAPTPSLIPAPHWYPQRIFAST